MAINDALPLKAARRGAITKSNFYGPNAFVRDDPDFSAAGC